MVSRMYHFLYYPNWVVLTAYKEDNMAINYKKIDSKIKNFRLKKQLTQETLAELCGLSSSYISYVETGKKKN